MPTLEDRILQALKNLTTLEVITRVGKIEVEKKPDGSDPTVKLTKGDFESGVYTRIDLVDGDTLNNLTPDMLDAAHAELRAFHQQAVKDAQGLVEKRIALIENAARWLGAKVEDLIEKGDAEDKKGGGSGGGGAGGQGGQGGGGG